ncbi:Uncharacterised protein [uncultured archaeon]|nr:Uncharacterised protein [uncultured archaeon]
MLFKGVGYVKIMKTEQEWMDELETEVKERTAKKDLCQMFDVEWSESLRGFSVGQLREQIGLRGVIAKKYGQRLRGEHFNKTPEEYERCLANIAVRTMTIPGRYSLKHASRIVGVPVDYLNQMRLKGIVSCKSIGRANFFSVETLKEELKGPAAQQFFAARRYEYQP